MNREEISYSIPIDLVQDILSRLPAKSVARFRCVSKLWGSMIQRPYFTELFLTRSWARPRLLFALELDDEWRFYSSLHPQNPYEKSALLVRGCSYKKVNPKYASLVPLYVSGLIYFPRMPDIINTVPIICNPSTGRYARLPESWRSFLGFDPIDEQFKVLSIGRPYHGAAQETQVLTLGTGNSRWRKIQCPFNHSPNNEAVCINGILYYTGYRRNVIVCFDVKFEEFRFIYRNRLFEDTLINYKGKLGGVKLKHDGGLSMWVLEDVEKQKWKIYDYIGFRDNKVIDRSVSVYGVTRAGEIVLSPNRTCKPFYVFYFNPETNTLRRVEIQGPGASLEGFNRIYTFVDHVENLNFLNIESS